MDDKIWENVCRSICWGGRVTSTEPTLKHWKQIYIQCVFQRRKAQVSKSNTIRSSFSKWSSLKKINVALFGLNKSGESLENKKVLCTISNLDI